MNQYRVSVEAKSDLREIWLYIADDNPEAADHLIRKIESRCLMLASNREIGRRREELAQQLRSFPVGNYVIFYRVEEHGIEVVRVLHGARDLPSLFK